MELDSIRATVASWASKQPIVQRAWIFGSRVRGTERPDSDVDIAIEVAQLPGDETAFCTFICESDALSEDLQRVVPIQVHLVWHGGPTLTPTVHAGLQESSILAYDRANISDTI